jgi:putative ABC transport system permease protein
VAIWRALVRGVRALTHRRSTDQDLADEIQDYFDRSAAEHERSGLPPHAARRAALVAGGNVTVVHEQVRSSGWEDVVETFFADVRYSLRRLARARGFTFVAVLTLGLGIGAATVIFSAIHPILIEALPYPKADRLASLMDADVNGNPSAVAFGSFHEIAERSRSFEYLALSDVWQPALTAPGVEPERLQAQQVTADYFRTLGVEPFAGRNFEAADDRPRGPRVAILSYGLLARRFGGDRGIVGRSVTLDGVEYTVIGVMPASFENVPLPAAEVWSTEQYQPNAPFLTREWGHHSTMFGRLRAGVSLSQAQAELVRLGDAPTPEFPRPTWAPLKNGLTVHTLQDDVTRTMRPALFALGGAVCLLLLIACVNIANLSVARAAQRRGEFAMRSALGAGGWRLVRQLLTESLVLSVLGGAAGLLLAAPGVRALVALAPDALPRVHAIHLDGMALWFAAGLTTIVGVLVGLIPALDAARREPQTTLQSFSTRTVGGRRATRSVLVVTEVSLALVLLIGAGLLMRSVRRLLSTAPGFDPTSVVSLQVEEVGARFRAAGCHMTCLDSMRDQYFVRVLDVVRGMPGVVSAAFTSQLPLSGDLDGYGAQTELDVGKPSDHGSALRYVVSPDYFTTMRIPLRRGRLLSDTDRRDGDEAVVVSESFARSYFGSNNPIGQHVRFGPETAALSAGGAPHPWDVVVGVVADVKQASLASTDADAFYVVDGRWQWMDNVQSLVVRTRGDAAALVPALKRAIWSVDANEPITRIATMEGLVAASAAQQRFALAIFGAFAAIALVLAAVGIYGVLSGSVTERVRELGVRSALGAAPSDILALVLRQGLVLAIAGVVIGLAGAAMATGALQSLLYGVTPLDPATYVGVAVVLVVVAVVACAGPALRAARVDVMEAMRAD